MNASSLTSLGNAASVTDALPATLPTPDAGDRVLALIAQALVARPLASSFAPPWRLRYPGPTSTSRIRTSRLLDDSPLED